MPEPLLLVFAAFGCLTLGAGVGLALTRSLIYAAFLLFIVLFGVAALFVFAAAPFLAVSQIVVYVGGILILILFGVMLTQRRLAQGAHSPLHNVLPAALLSLGLIGGLLLMLREVLATGLPWAGETTPPPGTPDNVQLIGKQFLTEYLLPFELVSILLLVALIGAAYQARPERR
jgi:NADH-quinone oxidoreductase subunit J